MISIVLYKRKDPLILLKPLYKSQYNPQASALVIAAIPPVVLYVVTGRHSTKSSVGQ